MQVSIKPVVIGGGPSLRMPMEARDGSGPRRRPGVRSPQEPFGDVRPRRHKKREVVEALPREYYLARSRMERFDIAEEKLRSYGVAQRHDS